MLERVTALLARDFDIAGVATDGRQAIAVAGERAPDAVVLDINMPGLDGYETKHALDESGIRAPVVFLSTFDSDDHVDEAFRCGARGYVLKSHIADDLVRALQHVLRGRLVVPSLPSLYRLTSGGGHAMQLYRDPAAFADGLAGFFDLALRRGDATCVIATEDIRDALDDCLRARGWDTGGTSRHSCYTLDAADALGRVMRNGLPDPSRVAEIAAELNDYRLSVGGGETRLTLFGNTVTVLLADGNTDGVIALESLWNSVTRTLPFFTLCGYSTASRLHEQTGPWFDACAEHSAVSHARHA